MAEFPFEQYLKALQQERQNKQAQDPVQGFAQGFQGGTQAGVQQSMENKDPDKDFRKQRILAHLQKGDEAHIKAVNPVTQIPEFQKLSDNEIGKYASTADKDMELYWIPKSDETEVSSMFSNTRQRESAKSLVKAIDNYADLKGSFAGAMDEVAEIAERNKSAYGGRGGQVAFEAQSQSGIIKDDKKFKDTAFVLNKLKSMVAKMLKKTFGGQLSEGEREYLNGLYGALPKMTVEEREIAISNVGDMLQKGLDAAKNKVDILSGKDVTKPKDQKKEQLFKKYNLE